jgi:flagellar hook-associated protein FlgK
VTDVQRMIDMILEGTILQQKPILAQTGTELSTLQSVEGLMGDLSSGGLSDAINRFFNALTELANQPESDALRTQAVWAGETLAGQFRHLADGLDQISRSIDVEAQAVAGQINTLATRAADLNAQVSEMYYRGLPDSNLLDQRDQAVAELCDLLDCQLQQTSSGTVSVWSGGIGLVVRNQAMALEAGYTGQGDLGVSVQGANYYDTQITGGRLGALLNLKNTILPQIRDALDGVAGQIVQQVNQEHVQGIGKAGSFTRLTGWMADAPLSAWEPPLTAGTFQVRVTATGTGAVTRTAIAVDPATDTLADVAARIDALDGVTASVSGSRLNIEAESGYRFDFLPALLPQPQTSSLTGTAQPGISGAYTGADNQTFTVRVVGTGQVSVTPGLALEVRDGGGDLVTTLGVGLGYAAGDPMDVIDGIRLALAAGTLNDGETFTIEALAQSDTSGFLAGAGINVFFQGNSAGSIRVTADLLSDPNRLATGLGADGTDNRNARRMADIGQAEIDDLGGLTIGDSYRRLTSDVGQQVAVRQARRDALQQAANQLAAQRDDTSGVDINQEAASLLVFEQMYHAVAKYLSVVNQANQYLFDSV